MSDPGPKPFSTLPRAGGLISRLACARLRGGGIDMAPLLAKSGLTEQKLDDPTAKLSVRSQIKFLDLAAAALGDELLGFHLALDFDPRQIGLLYYVLASSDFLGDAVRRAVRYSTIVNEGILLRTREGPQFTITLQYVGVERHLDRHQIEFWLASVVHICRHLTARRLLPCSMQVVHHRNAGSSELEAFLGRAIKFGAAADEIEFSDNLADMPVVSADPYLNELLVTYCEEHLAQTAPGARPLRVEIENAIAPLLPHGQAHLEELARRLGMSRRTLTRRLSSEGLTFARILNDMRADLARRYLRNEHLGISQIAWLLGYQEVSAFTHAFKRWTGSTPSKARGRG